MINLRREIEEYEADLYKVQEPSFLSRPLGLFMQSKHGELEMKVYDDGEREMKFKLHGLNVPDGATISIVVDENTAFEVRVERGQVRMFFSSARGDSISVVRNGSVVQIRHGGETLPEGRFRPD
jgi:hypothetical protein